MTLLDGSLSEQVDAVDNDAAAASASASITIQTDAADGEFIIMNGQTLEADTGGAGAAGNIVYTVGATITETLNNLANVLNGLDEQSVTGTATATTITAAEVQSFQQADIQCIR